MAGGQLPETSTAFLNRKAKSFCQSPPGSSSRVWLSHLPPLAERPLCHWWAQYCELIYMRTVSPCYSAVPCPGTSPQHYGYGAVLPPPTPSSPQPNKIRHSQNLPLPSPKRRSESHLKTLHLEGSIRVTTSSLLLQLAEGAEGAGGQFL